MEPILQTPKTNKTGKENRKCDRLGYSFIMCAGTVLQIKCHRDNDFKESREEVVNISRGRTEGIVNAKVLRRAREGPGWSVLGRVKWSVRLEIGELGESNMNKKNIMRKYKKKKT